MSIMCLPLSVQTPSDDRQNNLTVGEIIQTVQKVIALAENMSRKAPKAQALTEAEKRVLAKDTRTPTAELVLLSHDASPVVRNELIFNSSLPPAVLKQLAYDGDRFVASQARARFSLVA